MKMVLMIVDAGQAEDVKDMLRNCDVPGYSEIPNVLGMGTTGKKLGSRAFPGSSTLFMVAIEQHCVDMLTEKLAALREENGSSEGLKAFSFDIQELT
jgi:nitrogen regulatory protein PII